jgi:hypothetical protein
VEDDNDLLADLGVENEVRGERDSVKEVDAVESALEQASRREGDGMMA